MDMSSKIGQTLQVLYSIGLLKWSLLLPTKIFIVIFFFMISGNINFYSLMHFFAYQKSRFHYFSHSSSALLFVRGQFVKEYPD